MPAARRLSWKARYIVTAREQVAVAIQGHHNGAVAEELLNDLRGAIPCRPALWD
jgi:hypothetical protein